MKTSVKGVCNVIFNTFIAIGNSTNSTQLCLENQTIQINQTMNIWGKLMNWFMSYNRKYFNRLTLQEKYSIELILTREYNVMYLK